MKTIEELKNTVIQGNCLEKLKELEDNSVDSIVTDPPYELGFMGKSWDNTGIANNVELWKECLRVLKPGGHLLAFSGTRTYHRMAVAIEYAGFEVRDMIEWVYGSGFPKSLNIGKAVDKIQGNEREKIKYKARPETSGTMSGSSDTRPWIEESRKKGYHEVAGNIPISEEAKQWEGWGTALKPAHEPICMARKPLAEKTVAENCLKYGTGGINIDESRVEAKKEDMGDWDRFKGHQNSNTIRKNMVDNKTEDFNERVDNGVNNLGRFPANLIHDNSEEVRECFPETGKSTGGRIGNKGSALNMMGQDYEAGDPGYGDSGNASRFFKSIIYQSKASKSERNKGCEELEKKPKVFNGQSDEPSANMKDVEKRFTTLPKANNHPTVKPVALMEYLIKMVTPKGGIVLDPFAGSGTTGVACKNLNRNYILIEKEPEYIDIINKRLNKQDEK